MRCLTVTTMFVGQPKLKEARLAMQYVNDPLLVDGRKVEVRWVLMSYLPPPV